MINHPSNEIDEEVSLEQILFVRKEAQILDVISKYTEVRFVDGKYECKCPFEQSEEFRMRVYTESVKCECCATSLDRPDDISSGFFCCYSCGIAGDVFTLIEKIKGVNFLESVKHLATLYGYGERTRT